MEPELVDRLRSDLVAADYRLASISALWGSSAESARQRGVLSPARRALAARPADAPLGALASVFLLGDAISPERAERALPELGLEGALELGLLRLAGDDGAPPDGLVHAALSLNPVAIAAPRERADVLDGEAGGRPEEWWILSDLDDHLRRRPARADHVMGVGGATRSLLAQAPRGPRPDARGVEHALDLGTGCGVVAMYLARAGFRRVVATDISERALALARGNVRLNRIGDEPGDGSVEFRLGSLFEPVAGERFDLILSNPPFVITPRRAGGVPRYDYRDGGMTGDELARSVVREAPSRLVEGGTLLCLANWESPWGGNGLERVRGWIEAAAESAGPLDAWVVERDRVDPARYAETWARDGGARPGDRAFDALMEAWLADFAERRVVSIGLGSIRVRRGVAGATGDGVVRVEQAGGPFADSPGPGLAAAFSCGVDAERMSADEVLATCWVLRPDVVELREHAPGEEAPRSISLRVDAPIARTVHADTLLAGAVGACDGELTLGQIADALATLLEVDAGAAADALVVSARELAWLGVLGPAGP